MENLGGMIQFGLWALAVVLGISWLVLPWIVFWKLSGLIEMQRGVEESQKRMLHTLLKIEQSAARTASNTANQVESHQLRAP